MYRTDFWALWEKARVGCFKRTASKHVYHLGWNRSPSQVGCMRQVLGPGALGRPRGIGWRGRWEGGSGWGIHVYPWLIHVNVWREPLQCCEGVSLQLINKKKKIQSPKNWAPFGSCFLLIHCAPASATLRWHIKSPQPANQRSFPEQFPGSPGSLHSANFLAQECKLFLPWSQNFTQTPSPGNT